MAPPRHGLLWPLLSFCFGCNASGLPSPARRQDGLVQRQELRGVGDFCSEFGLEGSTLTAFCSLGGFVPITVIDLDDCIENASGDLQFVAG